MSGTQEAPSPQLAAILAKKGAFIGRSNPSTLRWIRYDWPEGAPRFPMPQLRYCMTCKKDRLGPDGNPFAMDVVQFKAIGSYVKLEGGNTKKLYFAGQCSRCLTVYWTELP